MSSYIFFRLLYTCVSNYNSLPYIHMDTITHIKSEMINIDEIVIKIKQLVNLNYETHNPPKNVHLKVLNIFP